MDLNKEGSVFLVDEPVLVDDIITSAQIRIIEDNLSGLIIRNGNNCRSEEKYLKKIKKEISDKFIKSMRKEGYGVIIFSKIKDSELCLIVNPYQGTPYDVDLAACGY